MKLLVYSPHAEFPLWQSERLAEAGFVLTVAATEQEAVSIGVSGQVEAMLLEMGAGLATGAAFVNLFRMQGVAQPILLVSEPGDWRDRVAAFDAGIDDYVQRPARTEEIAARLRAMIRRQGGNPTDRIVIGDLELDLKLKCGWLAGACLDLTRTEFRLLRMFMLSPDRMVSHSHIQERLQSSAAESSRNAIEVQIARLRRKIGAERIKTLRNFGYRFIVGDIGAGTATNAAAGPPSCKKGRPS